MSRYKQYYDDLKSDPIRYAAYLQRKRDEQKARPQYQADRKKSWRVNNAAKNKQLRDAHYAVERAVKSGVLIRSQTCENCGVECKTQGHHKSYAPDQLLVVVWLCQPCHLSVHSGSGF